MINNSWTLRGGKVFTPSPFALFGIVNITPDSFSDGGKYIAPAQALEHAQRLWKQGAAFLDLGAESSRPGAKPLNAEEEWCRLGPALSAILEQMHPCSNSMKLIQEGHTQEISSQTALAQEPKHLPPPPFISIDTYHADTAMAALEAGAHVINDISACRFEPQMLDIIAQYKPGYVLMHSFARPEIMQDNIQECNILPLMQHFFEEQLNRFTNAGLPEEHIILDMGIGFGKSLEQNLEILRNMHLFAQFGRPILAAISMKSVLHNFLSIPVENMEARSTASAVVTSLLAIQGIAYHRVHHVDSCAQALRMAHYLMHST